MTLKRDVLFFIKTPSLEDQCFHENCVLLQSLTLVLLTPEKSIFKNKVDPYQLASDEGYTVL